MTLHIISSSPYCANVIDLVLNRCAQNDGIILIQDGVYGVNHLPTLTKLNDVHKTKNIHCYALEDDMTARGSYSSKDNFINNSSFIARVSVEDFVTLTLTHSASISW
ncbi:sulfurtransferase complex subunit TusB [uncultured Paraglaciecola sp.]|uniref:sulfurtransferase complex subunit TusB n=1 Tax=uncultured Paraglaciecola sp. TaxID=1765024 RepID=UPI0030D95E2F|tara:strand:+ start:1872 stop:2192 length:321 start_codon:yes stop_codon:yes gene_type:complete